MSTSARHRGHRSLRVIARVTAGALVPIALTAVVILVAYWWDPGLVNGLASSTVTYALLVVTATVTATAITVRVLTGSDFAKFLAEAAFPVSAVALILTAHAAS